MLQFKMKAKKKRKKKLHINASKICYVQGSIKLDILQYAIAIGE